MTDTHVAIPPPGDLARLMAALDGEADGARYIGGWVRDTLLDQAPQDIDVATRLPPDEAAARARKAGLQVWTSASGLAHGTIGVVIDHHTIEVTTLRRDVATDGRHATVAFTDDWREDAARRDFTINALSADPVSGAVHDYFDGLADLRAGRVRFIGDPATRIAEDHLRILRFFRFHARFGRGAPDGPGYAACVARARDLMALSRERIAAELLKLLAVDDPAPAVRAMLGGDILSPVLPEIDGAAAARLGALVARERDHGEPADPIRRLAALLPADPAIAADIARRLRLSKADQLSLEQAAIPDAPGAVRPLAYAIGISGALDRLLLRAPDDAIAPGLEQVRGWTIPRLRVKGGQLVEAGIGSGPLVAQTLRRIERSWIEAGFPDDARLDAIVDEEVGRALSQQ
jgi:poly(A) polymerase